MAAKLDELDLRLLGELQQNNQLSMAELAERVNSSPATCIRRVRRLREEKVIIADVSIIDPAALGRTMTVIVEVNIERERADLIELFKKSVLKCDQISHCYYVTGDADFVLFVHVADMEEYDEIISRLFHDNGNIKQFKTLVAIRRVKNSTRFPIRRFVDS
ncbi:Lrp/AsnC family transcriptional regulator [Oceanibacterium hippocampi]|uniref:Leucine-responsive regulatory protein n=1 Tax=Oceanibacterium hippocampi TaxID=745714 RepID=A0A1Y5TX71_9PROT|nr:Lrp/AsnC family transcriptional regulator [Oceanibacterium hippocampi]SLN75577.1 Leucine-responsive regulatory protein [Oceanibacterium hippocampi]